MLLVELIEWCKRKANEAGTEKGYYHKIADVLYEALDKE